MEIPYPIIHGVFHYCHRNVFGLAGCEFFQYCLRQHDGPNDIERWEALMGFSAFKNYATIGTTFAMTLVLACLLNLFPDYLSLIQSRVIIGRMVGKSFGKCLMYFVLDLTLTTIIALTVISIWLLIQIDTVSNFHLFLERVIATGIYLERERRRGSFQYIWNIYLQHLLYLCLAMALYYRGFDDCAPEGR